MKKKLSKIEIATYLRDFSKFKNYIIWNSQVSFYECFKKMLYDEGRGQFANEKYYIDMILVYTFFLLNRKFSFMSDVLFDYLLEDNISNISIPDYIFVNQKDRSRFSKKKILKYIRNALNHNDKKDSELYNLFIDNSDIKIEIFLKNVKPIPFHIVMTIDEYLNIMHGLRNANKLDLISFKTTDTLDFSNDLYKELDKVYYRRFYFKHKINSNVREEFEKKIYEADEDLIDFLKNENISFNDYKLSVVQKNKIIEDLNFFKKYSKMDESFSINSIVPNIVPLGIVKNDQINFEIEIIKNYLLLGNKCFMDIAIDAKDLYYEKNDLEQMLKVFNVNAFNNLSLSIYYSYLFDTLITDEKVVIGNEVYDREKIRNSFVHGRWFNGVCNCFHLYDCDNGDSNELNYNWRAIISDDDFENASEKYYNHIFNENKNDVFFNYPLHIHVENDTFKSMTYTKNGVSYIYNLDIEDYNNKDFMTWGLYTRFDNEMKFVDSIDEAKMFFENVLNNSKKDKWGLEKLVLFFHYQNMLCIGYNQGKISLEELRKNDNYYLNLINQYREICEDSKKL